MTGQAHVVGVAATVSATGVVGMIQTSTLMARVAALEQRVTEAERSAREVKDSLQVEVEARKDADNRRLEGQIAGLRAAIRDLERATTEIDANALPIVVLGIVLTTIGDWIALNAWWAVVMIIVAVVSSLVAAALLLSHRPIRKRT